jgi:hypothetical protein
VSATTRPYPAISAACFGNRQSPAGSENRAPSGPPSTRPRSPLPKRRTTVAPSAPSSTTRWWAVSETNSVPDGPGTALAGNRSTVAGSAGGT